MLKYIDKIKEFLCNGKAGEYDYFLAGMVIGAVISFVSPWTSLAIAILISLYLWYNNM